MPSAQLRSANIKERRIAARRQPTMGTVCYLASNDGNNLGMGLVWNLSSTGISMLLNRGLESGTTVLAQLATMNAEFTLPLTLRVAHVALMRTGDFILGGQFSRELTETEMRNFVGQ
jgi:hypothetical protein